MYTIFRPLRFRATKDLPCPRCGKKVRRAKTFEMTVNPFNVNEAGVPCSPGEVWAKLAAKAAEWAKVPEPCSKCKDAD